MKGGDDFFSHVCALRAPVCISPLLHYTTSPSLHPCHVRSPLLPKGGGRRQQGCVARAPTHRAPPHRTHPRGARRGHPARVGSHCACFARTAATHHRTPPSPPLPCRECGARSSRLSGEQLRLPRVSTHSRHLPPCHACPRTSHARSPPTLRRSSLVSPVAPLRLCRGHLPPRRSAPRRSRPPCRMSWTRRTWQREWA